MTVSTKNILKFSAFVGFCAAIVAAGVGGSVRNATGQVGDNVAEASGLNEDLEDLGSISSGLLAAGLSFEGGFTPVSGPAGPSRGTEFSSAGSEFSSSGAEISSSEEEHVKTITVTKNVPVPYAVTVEKRVPVRVEVPVDKPYPVYVPRPYQVVVEKKVPYEVKVPVPQPYTVEKHVPVPVKVHVARPYPVHVPAPYPVFMVRKVPYTIEKHIPFPVKVPVVRHYPVPIQVEKQVPYPVEKAVPYPVQVTVERPVPVPVEKPYPVHVEKPVPVPVEKLIPVPVTVPVRIPIKVPVPFPVVSQHPHISGSPSNDEYFLYKPSEEGQHQQYLVHGNQQQGYQNGGLNQQEHQYQGSQSQSGQHQQYLLHGNQQQGYQNGGLTQQEHQYQGSQSQDYQYQGNQPQEFIYPGSKQQEYQYQGQQTKDHGNAIIESETSVHQEVSDGLQQNHQVGEQIDHQQPSYHYERIPGYLQPQAFETYEAHQQSVPPKAKVVAKNASDQSALTDHSYSKYHRDAVTRGNTVDNKQKFLSVEEYGKAIHNQYLQQRQAPGNHAANEYDGSKTNGDGQDGKQESYFKVDLGSSVYTNSVHHSQKVTGQSTV